MKDLLNKEAITREVYFKTSRSSGKGGQHVNKVSTRADAFLDIQNANCFTDEEKQLLFEKLAARISQAGILQVGSQEERSQFLNKERALEKLLDLLERSLKPVKPRKATKPGRGAVEKRLREKSVRSSKKENRKKPEGDRSALE
ncbi:MAG TPA: alternative ribosome rescue aminoacyl-tRNA hydrolase ArfB [Anseongella sp.]